MMLQSHAHIKDSFKVQDRTIDFKVTEYEKCSCYGFRFTLQLTFKKMPLVEFWCAIRKEYPQKAVRRFLLFLAIYLCDTEFSSLTSTKKMHCNRVNAEADMRIKLFSIKPGIKEALKKCKTKPFFSLNFFVLEKLVYFHKNIFFTLIYNWFIIVIFKWINI